MLSKRCSSLLAPAALSVLSAVLLSTPVFSADWNKRLAADYLDSRAKAWSEWSTARAPGGTCISCHTNLTYLIARPVLTKALGESSRSTWEKSLIEGVQFRLHQEDLPRGMFTGYAKEPYASQAAGVNAIIAALSLAHNDAGRSDLNADTKLAFDRLWSLQIQEGDARGGWPWFDLSLDPWEMPDSAYFGASMAALAIGYTPAVYRNQPEIRVRIAELSAYLDRASAKQPLHNRLAQAWASSRLPEAMSSQSRRSTIAEVLKKQQPDGSWNIEALGPFPEHPNAPPPTGNPAYATAWVAFTLQQAGVPSTDPKLARALTWLKVNQNSADGYWDGQSMNKVYPPDSMQIRFVRDAATAYATLALLAAE